MPIVKVSEATPPQINWMVAKCEGPRFICEDTWLPNYSTDWSQGGPVIEREKIELAHIPDVDINKEGAIQPWVSSYSDYKFEQCGPTPLIAAMRCYVVSESGDEVEVPDELS